MTLGNMCGRGMHYLIGSCLVLILSLSLLNSHANTKVISEKDQEAARAAWAKAVSLAQERNSDRICESEAYQSTIILELSVAVKLSPISRMRLCKASQIRSKLSNKH